MALIVNVVVAAALVASMHAVVLVDAAVVEGIARGLGALTWCTIQDGGQIKCAGHDEEFIGALGK